MKYLIQLAIALSLFLPSFAQSDTIYLYLDADDKTCTEEKAVRYAIQHKENDHWKRVAFDINDDKVIYGAYYADAACTRYDGLYTAFNKKARPILTGRYTDNKKTGIWKGYSDDGKLIDSAFYQNGFIVGLALSWYPDGAARDSLEFEKEGKGTGRGFWPDGKPRDAGSYLSGKKNGLWVYYYKEGGKCQEVVYESDSALSYTCFDKKGLLQANNCHYEKEASFKGGEKGWREYLIRKLSGTKYPEAYLQGRVYGIVSVQFKVGIDGKVLDSKVIKSVDPDLDRIALAIIDESPRWEPAVQYNRNVIAYRRQPITFTRAE